MTQLVINVVDISGGTHPDDKVRLWAPQHRPDGERVVSTSPVDVKLTDGQATVEVLPGPARVQIMTQGVVDSAPKKVTIPDEASVTLRAVIEDGLEWEPEVVSRVAVLASRAESAADRAENVADTFGSLEGVAVSVQAAQDAATSAEADRVAVEQAATSASWSGDRLTVLGATSPPLTGPQGPEGPQGEKGDPVVVSTTPPEDTDTIWVNPSEVPPAEQDTGWRNIAGTVKLWPTDTWDSTSDTLWIRRVGSTVHLMHERSTDIPATSWGVGDNIPVGFRPAVDAGLIVHGRDNNTGGYLLRTSGMTVWTGPNISSAYFMAPMQSWLTTDPWPTTLPGTAVEGV